MDDLIGTQIRKYQITGKLGAGGMGSVFKARDTILERDVALKLLSPTLASDDSFVERFRLEARSLAKLDHPHIVKVFDADWVDNKLFIVMEYVEGGSLADLIKQEGALPSALVVTLLEQAAEGLDYAHQRGLIHRDIKPANILLDRQGNAHLTDFGLVKDAETALTADGMRLGTPAYMAPEQIQGQEVTPAVDIYALGIVAYEMLTGSPPFTGTMSAIFEGHLLRQPPPISERNPALPAEVQEVVLTGLAKKPFERYPSAAAFVRALKGSLQAAEKRPSGSYPVTGTPTPAPSPSGVGPLPGQTGAPASGPVSPPRGVPGPSGPVSGPVHPPSGVQKSGRGGFLSGLGLGVFGAIALIVLLVACACGGIFLLAGNLPETPPATPLVVATSTEEPAPTATSSPPPAAPTPTETFVPTVSGPVILFQDDFSNPASGWDSVRHDTGMTDYDQGGYRIQVLESNTDYWANPGLAAMADVLVQVQVWKVAGPDDNDFGVICRYQDTENFYAFLGSSDGYFGIMKVLNGKQDLIGAEVLEFTEAIIQGPEAVNLLRADCVGSTLTFYINDILVFTVEDFTFSAGDVGLIAGTFDQPGADILFDNFVVYQP